MPCAPARKSCRAGDGDRRRKKTRLAAEIVRLALSKGKRVAFIVPLTTLVDQTAAAFMAEGIEAIGVMQAAHRMTDASQPVQVISAQTLARRKRPDVDLVIVDESCAAQSRAAMDARPPGRALHRPFGNAVGARHGPLFGTSCSSWRRLRSLSTGAFSTRFHVFAGQSRFGRCEDRARRRLSSSSRWRTR